MDVVDLVSDPACAICSSSGDLTAVCWRFGHECCATCAVQSVRLSMHPARANLAECAFCAEAGHPCTVRSLPPMESIAKLQVAMGGGGGGGGTRPFSDDEARRLANIIISKTVRLITCELCNAPYDSAGVDEPVCPHCNEVPCNACKRKQHQGACAVEQMIAEADMSAALKAAQPSNSTKCSTAGCGVYFKHMRDDGCHIMTCPGCKSVRIRPLSTSL